jgi:tellurite resistance protein TehA-like permease
VGARHDNLPVRALGGLPKARSVGPANFALVMATGIVSTAAQEEGHQLVSAGTLVVAAVAFVVLAALSLLRLVGSFADVRADFTTPTRCFGFFAVVAGSAILGERLYDARFETASFVLLAVAALGWLVLGYAVPAVVMLGSAKPGLADAVDGTWLLWVVATQSISTAAAQVADHPGVPTALAATGAVATWAIGVVLYLSLLTLLLLRLLVAPVAPAKLTAPYWIIMGATAITVLAGSRLLGLDPALSVMGASAPVVEGLSLILWAFGTWTIPLLVIFGLWRHVRHRDRLTYTPELWAIVFPLGMYTTATAEFGAVTRQGALTTVAEAAYWVALGSWLAVFAALLASLAGAAARARRRRRRAL